MIKIKEELFVDKKHHLEFVYVSIDSVSGIIFYDFVANSVRRFFFSSNHLTPTSQILSLSWYLLVQLLQLPLKFHLSKRSRNEAILNPVPRQ